MIGVVAAEVARREAAGEEEAPPIYLVIFNGGRFRDLRRSEDDFSFSVDRDKPPSPDKQWAEILRNGPAWGIHTLVWCDTYNNVNRLFDRMAIREFEMRIAFQMSAADSSSLLDNPAAAKLRQHRGLFASEDLGTLEKFRPYGIPTAAWLDEVRRRYAKASSRERMSASKSDKTGIIGLGRNPFRCQVQLQAQQDKRPTQDCLGHWFSRKARESCPNAVVLDG